MQLAMFNLEVKLVGANVPVDADLWLGNSSLFDLDFEIERGLAFQRHGNNFFTVRLAATVAISFARCIETRRRARVDCLLNDKRLEVLLRVVVSAIGKLGESVLIGPCVRGVGPDGCQTASCANVLVARCSGLAFALVLLLI